jgi:hypothetical protein
MNIPKIDLRRNSIIFTSTNQRARQANTQSQDLDGLPFPFFMLQESASEWFQEKDEDEWQLLEHRSCKLIARAARA